MKKNNLLFTYIILVISVLLFITIFCIINFNASLSLAHLFTDTKSFESEQSLSFSNIQTVKMDVNDVFVSIIESNVDEVTITSTVKNTGIGFVTQPKAWINGNTLYFKQGDVIGFNAAATGEITLELPKNLELNYDISNSSGDVLLKVSTANDVDIDMAVGELNLYTSCKNFTINSVSGDINIYKAIQNITAHTVSSDVSLFANATTNEINFESVSGDCTVFVDELNGYNLYYKYAGGNIDDFFELSNNFNNIINITAETVDGKVEVFDKSIIDDISNFFKEENKNGFCFTS